MAVKSKSALSIAIVISTLLYYQESTTAHADTPVAPGILLVGAMAFGFAVGKEIFGSEAEMELGLGVLPDGDPQGARVMVQERFRVPVASRIPGIETVRLSENFMSARERGVEAGGRFVRVAGGPFVTLSIKEGDFGGDLFRWRNATDNESLGYRVLFKGFETFTREDDATESGLALDINYIGSLMTVSMPETDAAVSFLLNVTSPELGKLFTGTIGIREDAPRPVIEGDFAGASHTMRGRGRADIKFTARALMFDVPDDIERFTLEYEVAFLGVATEVED